MPGSGMTGGVALLRPGDRTRFTKTVGEADVYLFAGISGDFARNHVDEAHMARSGAGGRIAHGALIVAYMSAASTRMTDRLPDDAEWVPVSRGYDRIRFLKPVRIGDTVTVDYAVEAVEEGAQRGTAAVEVRNQRGELVAVATHAFALVRRDRLFPDAGRRASEAIEAGRVSTAAGRRGQAQPAKAGSGRPRTPGRNAKSPPEAG